MFCLLTNIMQGEKMRVISRFNKVLLLSLSVLLLSCTSTSLPKITIDDSPQTAEKFQQFSLNNSNDTQTISYGGFSYFLYSIVLDVGFSTRDSTVSDNAFVFTGTRIPRGNASSLVLESNRIDFSNLTTQQMQLISYYSNILENIPKQRPLSEFNRQEQLAYWLNLHNIKLIEMIAINYPVKSIDNLKINVLGNSYYLLDAPVVNIQGVNLSLNDIRKNIVYRYWRDTPEVMYGFFLGTLGGPSIIPRAYQGPFVYNYLNRNASEFINSNRGVKNFYSTIYISSLYEAHSEIFFNTWPDDLFSHLNKHARSPTTRFLSNVKQIKFSRYNDDLATIYDGPSEAERGPGAPSAQAVSIDATSGQVLGADNDPGPLGGSFPDTGVLDGQLLGTIGDNNPSANSARAAFLSRVQRKKRRAPNDFWPSINKRERNVTIEDLQ